MATTLQPTSAALWTWTRCVRVCMCACDGFSSRGVTGHQVIHPAGSHPCAPCVTHGKHRRVDGACFTGKKEPQTKYILFLSLFSCYLEFRLQSEPSVVTVSFDLRLFTAVKLADLGKYFFLI